jgi:diaminopimelate epimerase
VIQVLESGRDWVEIAIWNPDGSRAEMSGNGTRVAARWHGGDDVTVRVGPRDVRAVLREDGLVEQDLGEVITSEPEEIDGIRFVAVDVGNPHAVVEGDPDDLPRIGPLLETHSRFPARTNVQVARRVDQGEVGARVWERGAGETASSGTSAVAVAAAFGFRPVIVRFPGGPLEVHFDGRRAFLAGPAVRIA